jgi:hypothetical protein
VFVPAILNMGSVRWIPSSSTVARQLVRLLDTPLVEEKDGLTEYLNRDFG